MFDQLKHLLTYIMNYGQNSSNIELAFKLAIGMMVLYTAFYFFFKRKSRGSSDSGSKVNTATPHKDVPVEPETQVNESGTDLVDRKLIKNLKYRMTLDDDLIGLRTEQGHDTKEVFDKIKYFIRHASDIADELKENEAKYNKGVSISTRYYGDVSMDNYNVELVTDMGIIRMSLSELSTVSSVEDLRGHIDDGLFLSREAFYIIPATI